MKSAYRLENLEESHELENPEAYALERIGKEKQPYIGQLKILFDDMGITDLKDEVYAFLHSNSEPLGISKTYKIPRNALDEIYNIFNKYEVNRGEIVWGGDPKNKNGDKEKELKRITIRLNGACYPEVSRILDEKSTQI